MKKYITLIMVAVCAATNAQNIDDVLRYSTDNLQGTARFQAMSGAFGALGGDLSSLNINPAGSAVFNNSQFTISGTNFHVKNENSYNGSNPFNTTENNFDINQIGGVFVFNNSDPNAKWKKFSIGLNFDKVQSFDNYINANYTTTQGIDNYFLSFAEGLPLGPLKLQDGEFTEEAYLDIGSSLGFVEQQAFLGIFGGVIDAVDPDNDNNTAYISTSEYASVSQNYRKISTGYNDKYTFNMASQYEDNLYVGASINVHSIFLDQLTELTENGYDANSQVQFTTFDNLLRSRGNAFSFSLGAIAKVNNSVRLGGSYQSPTWYRISDEFSQRINSTIADEDIGFINFNLINAYDKYTIKTPGKVTGSLALVFGKDGLLSLDYGYQDMSNAELRPDSDPAFAAENNYISNQLQAVSSVRLGGEYRIKQVSLRAGYRYEQSPYENNVIGDLNGISGGLGYNFGPSKLDLAVNSYSQDRNATILSTDPTANLNSDNTNTNVTLSYTLNF
ncbi:OmpP1/FadL family transporter [Cellulophaga sp. L1A9]|uniref:OmpP1/FadL family transporter n=1 Tax=Cellulophaga sp. L1A9 TaxID=2686362 RepID=UPI00131BF747|nr:outer membrane protein transport protein [Cellulophaga sp. L1A9]